ncbi:hypothetical protein [Singulisphaera acidiphila]|nr:hypothetical protein [Singulisphaera acidiphila]
MNSFSSGETASVDDVVRPKKVLDGDALALELVGQGSLRHPKDWAG